MGEAKRRKQAGLTTRTARTRSVSVTPVPPHLLLELLDQANTDPLAAGKIEAIIGMHSDCAVGSAVRTRCLICKEVFPQSEIIEGAVFLFVGPDDADGTESETTTASAACARCILSLPYANVQRVALEAYASMFPDAGHA